MQNRKNRGFTLIELLMVIAIIALLMGLLVGIGRYARIKSLEGRAKSDMQHIANALNEYQLKNAIFPATIQIAAISNSLPRGVDTLDPWDHPYLYTPGAGNLNYKLICEGRSLTSSADDLIPGK